MITSERKTEILKAAIRLYGEPAQIDMTIAGHVKGDHHARKT